MLLCSDSTSPVEGAAAPSTPLFLVSLPALWVGKPGLPELALWEELSRHWKGLAADPWVAKSDVAHEAHYLQEQAPLFFSLEHWQGKWHTYSSSTIRTFWWTSWLRKLCSWEGRTFRLGWPACLRQWSGPGRSEGQQLWSKNPDVEELREGHLAFTWRRDGGSYS